MTHRSTALFLGLLLSVTAVSAQDAPEASAPPATKAAAPKSIADLTTDLEAHEGFFPFYWDAKKGTILLEIPAGRMDEAFLYVESMPAGVGSNDIGLDRGQLGAERVVKFIRSGPKVLLVQPNLRYRADSEDELERMSVEQAFARSALAGFTVLAESDGRVLIDLTSFLLRDSHGIARTLERRKQGSFKVDASRSMLVLDRTKAFPDNSEFEGLITFDGKPADGAAWLRSVVPSPEAITVQLHHSFVRLPDAGYSPRRYDPRSGYGFTAYLDYATPIDRPIQQRFINRHRLAKVDPTAAVSEAVEPIIYYLDPGTPEPIRSALIEGASWWNQAFEAAGYRDAFQVKVLPADADPMDVRYNLIQWVHRSTRGWSYGASVVDPRTGEIIKGQVSLGSLRARQDFLIAAGLTQPYGDGEADPELMEMVLQRIRQLSAHEVGHTLGLRHNYASSVNTRASVMDYPHPLVSLDANGEVDLSQAYDVGIGAYDKQAIKFGYADFAPGIDEAAALDAILAETREQGLLYITDQDARPQGGAHPLAHLWDNGADAAAELNRVLALRRKVLDGFSLDALRPGAPVAELEEVLVPMYLFHRYQVEAAVKVVGGLDFNYAVKGDGQTITAMLSPAVQDAALDALLSTLSPETLMLPESLLELLAPRAPGYPGSRETFERRTDPEFDPLVAAENAADLTVGLLLHPARAERLRQHHMRDAAQPSFVAVVDRLVAATWKSGREDGYAGEVQRVVEVVILDRLLNLAQSAGVSEQVRALTYRALVGLDVWLANTINSTPEMKTEAQVAHMAWAHHRLTRWFEDPTQLTPAEQPKIPDGSPIGMDDGLACGM